MVVGTLAIAAGWSWGAMLIVFFVTSSALSRLGAARKRLRTVGVVEKGEERDERQVLANGALFALTALLALAAPWPGWYAAGAGALAAAAADTWGTELGTLARTPPRLITTGERVPAGTSGAVSEPGLLGTLAGALFLSGAAWALGWGARVAAAALAGGVAGGLADSLVGALWQERRHCPACGAATEQRVHRCGARTVAAGGVAGLDNDVVNAVATLAGGGTALLVWSVVRSRG